MTSPILALVKASCHLEVLQEIAFKQYQEKLQETLCGKTLCRKRQDKQRLKAYERRHEGGREDPDEGQRQKKRGAAGRCSATATQAERTLRQEANTEDVGCKPAADQK